MALEDYLKQFQTGVRSADRFINLETQQDLQKVMRSGLPGIGTPGVQEQRKQQFLGSAAFRGSFSAQFPGNPRSARYQGAKAALQTARGKSPPMPTTGQEWLRMYGRRR